jgi:uncharacterized protein (TIGR02466 family)
LPVFEIFPTAVKIEQLTIEQVDLDKILQLSRDTKNLNKNTKGNFFHSQTYIFDEVLKGSQLVKDVSKSIDEYTVDVLGEEPNIRYTQSWLNVNPPGSGHHKHLHYNSILSGVLYIQTNDDCGDFVVHQEEEKRMFKTAITQYNRYNQSTCNFKPKNNELYIFPSTLHHSVRVNRSLESRISLSFNTFYAGDMERYQLADLKFSRFNS